MRGCACRAASRHVTCVWRCLRRRLPGDRRGGVGLGLPPGPGPAGRGEGAAPPEEPARSVRPGGSGAARRPGWGGAESPGPVQPCPPGGARSRRFLRVVMSLSHGVRQRRPGLSLLRRREASPCAAVGVPLFGVGEGAGGVAWPPLAGFCVNESLSYSGSKQQSAGLSLSQWPRSPSEAKQHVTPGDGFCASWNVTFPAINYYISITLGMPFVSQSFY